MVYLVGSLESKTFPRPVVKSPGHADACALRQVIEWCSFRQILSDQTVGIFVGPPFPCMMGQGEVDVRIQSLLNPAISMKLAAIVRGNGFHSIFITQEQSYSLLFSLLHGDALELADANQAAAPFHNGDDSGLRRAVNRVDLPITDP